MPRPKKKKKPTTALQLALATALAELVRLNTLSLEQPLDAVQTKQLETYSKIVMSYKIFKQAKLAKDIEALNSLSDEDLHRIAKETK